MPHPLLSTIRMTLEHLKQKSHRVALASGVAWWNDWRGCGCDCSLSPRVSFFISPLSPLFPPQEEMSDNPPFPKIVLDDDDNDPAATSKKARPGSETMSSSVSLDFLADLTVEEINVTEISSLSRAALIDKIVELNRNLVAVTNQFKSANVALKVSTLAPPPPLPFSLSSQFPFAFSHSPLMLCNGPVFWGKYQNEPRKMAPNLLSKTANSPPLNLFLKIIFVH